MVGGMATVFVAMFTVASKTYPRKMMGMPADAEPSGPY